MNTAACSMLATLPENRTWFRAVQAQYASTPLNTAHTAAAASRFNEGNNQFEILYFAFDHKTAMYEVQAMLGSPLHGVTLPNPYQAWLLANVDVILYDVVDLTDVAVQNQLSTSVQELTGDWRGYQLRSRTTPVSQPTGVPAPTQELGSALYQVRRIEGFWAPSARVPTSKILAVFPDKLRQPGSRSSLVLRDHQGNVIQRIP